jgi:hypothetical protein
MSFLDTIAGIILGAYLLAVAAQGNSGKLIDLAKRDKAFLQWAIAVGILMYLYSIPELKSNVGLIIAGSFIGLGIVKGPVIMDQGSKFWNSLGA